MPAFDSEHLFSKIWKKCWTTEPQSVAQLGQMRFHQADQEDASFKKMCGQSVAGPSNRFRVSCPVGAIREFIRLKRIRLLQKRVSTEYAVLHFIKQTGEMALFFWFTEPTDWQSIENGGVVRNMSGLVCQLGASLRGHLACERACSTISTSNFRVSAGLLTSLKNAMRAPRIPSGVLKRT